jgi:ribosomal-protein-alanine N-acetyltransferase
MNALLQPRVSLRTLSLRDVDAVVAVELVAYAFPWSRGNFIDSLSAAYVAEMLVDEQGTVLGYYVAMPGVDEMHLLNLTVAPAWQRRGHSRVLLDALERHCQERGLATLWLEVRAGNQRARELYARRGFVEVGVRKNYYPAGLAKREDALVMSMPVPMTKTS